METFSSSENFFSINNNIFTNNLELFPSLKNTLTTTAQHLSSNAHARVRVIAAKNGYPVPVVNNIVLHSRFNPVKEAERSVANLSATQSHYIVPYLNFLYSVQAMLFALQTKLRNTKKYLYLLILVSDIQLFIALLQTRNLTFLKQFKKVTWMFSSEFTFVFKNNSNNVVIPENCILANSLEEGVARWCAAINASSFHGFLFFENQRIKNPESSGSTQIKPSSSFNYSPASIKTLFIEEGKKIATSKVTNFSLVKKWWVNAIINLKNLKNCNTISLLRNVHANATFVLLASGPSLDEQVSILLRIKENTNIITIATDSALPILSALFFVPNYVVALDAGYYNTLDFIESYSSFKEKKPKLLFHPALYPTVLRMPLFSSCYLFLSALPKNMSNSALVGQLILINLFSTKHIQHLQSNNILKLTKNTEISFKNAAQALTASKLETGGSVASAACMLAKYMGAKSVVFMGLDLCSPYLHSHAASSMHDRYRLNTGSRLQQREAANFLPLQNYSNASKNNFFVTPSHKHYLNEMLAICANGILSGMQFFSLSPYFFKAHSEKLLTLNNKKTITQIAYKSTFEKNKEQQNYFFLNKQENESSAMQDVLEIFNTKKNSVPKVEVKKNYSLNHENQNNALQVNGEILKQVQNNWHLLAENYFKKLENFLLQYNQEVYKNESNTASSQASNNSKAHGQNVSDVLQQNYEQLLGNIKHNIPPLYQFLLQLGISEKKNYTNNSIAELRRQLNVFAHYSKL